MLGISWTITPEIKKLLDEISALNLVFQKYHPHPDLISSLRRQSILSSAVFSARIENVPVRIEDPRVAQKLEVQNLVIAYNYIFSSRSPRHISVSLIRNLHRLALKNLSASAGQWRVEPWAIFNSSGVAVYLAPAPFRLPDLITQYISFNKSISEPAPVLAAVSQFAFEKIHPFADGNGRVGRLISALVLEKSGLGQVSEFEKYLDDHRSEYYQVLEPNQNCTQFIEFFLTSLVSSAQFRLEQLKSPQRRQPEAFLLPRRQELLAIVRDHPQCSFDFLSRRFPGVNPHSLHYDLLQLQKIGLIVKHGVSRGALYSSASS